MLGAGWHAAALQWLVSSPDSFCESWEDNAWVALTLDLVLNENAKSPTMTSFPDQFSFFSVAPLFGFWISSVAHVY